MSNADVADLFSGWFLYQTKFLTCFLLNELLAFFDGNCLAVLLLQCNVASLVQMKYQNYCEVNIRSTGKQGGTELHSLGHMSYVT